MASLEPLVDTGQMEVMLTGCEYLRIIFGIAIQASGAHIRIPVGIVDHRKTFRQRGFGKLRGSREGVIEALVLREQGGALLRALRRLAAGDDAAGCGTDGCEGSRGRSVGDGRRESGVLPRWISLLMSLPSPP